MLTIGVSFGRKAIEEIAGDWDRLVADGETSVFVRPGWYLAWVDAFQPKDRDFVIITARDQNRLVGVLPLPSGS